MSVRPVEAVSSLAGAPPPAGSSLHRFANPGRFLRLSGTVLPWLVVPALLLTATAWSGACSSRPPTGSRATRCASCICTCPPPGWRRPAISALAVCSVLSLVWRHPLADLAAVEIGPVGAGFTALCLATGSLWGKPMWGAWWVWDARLTSVLVLFFLYLGHIALVRAFDDPVRGYRAGAILALVGVVNLPIIKFSVDWWNTLHQPDDDHADRGADHGAIGMLWPLLVSALGFSFAFAAIVVARLRAAVMERRIRGLLMARARSRDDASAVHRRVLCAGRPGTGLAWRWRLAAVGCGAAAAGRHRPAARAHRAMISPAHPRCGPDDASAREADADDDPQAPPAWIVLACGVGFGSATALVLLAFSDNLVFFVSPSDLAKSRQSGRSVRLGGLVEQGSVRARERSGNRPRRSVSPTATNSVKVNYDGILPDLFREGQGVVALGKLTAGWHVPRLGGAGQAR